MAQVDLDRFMDGHKFHKKGTLIVTITGSGAAAKATPNLVASALLGPGGVPSGGIADIYRLESPTRWFVNLNQAAHIAVYKGLHGKKFKLPIEGLEISIEHVEKERERVTIHWLPNTISAEGVKFLVSETIGDQNAEVFRIQYSGGKWGVLCNPTKDVPHYVQIKAPGTTNGHRILYTMPGRKTQCPNCFLDDHWGNKCPTRMRKKENKNKSTESQQEEFPALSGETHRKPTHAAQDGAGAAGRPEATRPADETTTTTTEEGEKDGFTTVQHKRKRQRKERGLSASSNDKDIKEEDGESSPSAPSKRLTKSEHKQNENNPSDGEGPLFINTDSETEEDDDEDDNQGKHTKDGVNIQH